jgi:hypothetical protein
LLNRAYGEDCMSRTQCYEWFKHFKEGRMSVGEDPRPGRPWTLTNDDHVERVRAVIRGNCRLLSENLQTKWKSALDLAIKFLLKNFSSVASVQNSFCVCWLLIRRSGKTSDIRCAPIHPHSPDSAPADVFLFPKLKTALKEHRFQTIEEIQENAIIELRAVKGSAFQEIFQQWKKRFNTPCTCISFQRSATRTSSVMLTVADRLVNYQTWYSPSSELQTLLVGNICVTCAWRYRDFRRLVGLPDPHSVRLVSKRFLLLKAENAIIGLSTPVDIRGTRRYHPPPQPVVIVVWWYFNLLKTKRWLLYLKTQFVPRSKHFSSRL